MTTEDLQGQVARSAAVERELREQVARLKAAETRLREELAEAAHTMKALRTDKEEWKGAYNRAQRDANEAIAALAEARGALRLAQKALRCETCDPDYPGQMEVVVYVESPDGHEVCQLEPCAECESYPDRVAARSAIDAALARAGEQRSTKGSAGELGDRSGHADIEPSPAPSRNTDLRTLIAQLLGVVELAECENCETAYGEEGGCVECAGVHAAVVEAREAMKDPPAGEQAPLPEKQLSGSAGEPASGGQEEYEARRSLSRPTPTPPPGEQGKGGGEGPHYGRDCPVGMVQVEFVGCSPSARYSEYGWKPTRHAFLEVYVDGKRFRIDVGEFEDGHARRRGLHIVTDAIGIVFDKTAMNSASIYLAPAQPAEHPAKEK